MSDQDLNGQEESKQDDYIPCEKVSYSFLFFMVSGATLLVTLWAFWDDEYSRRGFKAHQEEYFKHQYALAEEELIKVNESIAAKEIEVKKALAKESEKLEDSDEYERLADEALDAQIKLGEVKENKKFAGSRLDEAYYFYKKAMHKGDNYDVQLAHMKGIEKEISDFGPKIAAKERIVQETEARLMEFKVQQVALEKELRGFNLQRETLKKTMDYYKPFPFFWKPAEILQTVIPGFSKNSFAEIIYRVDRCMTCHISYKDKNYENFAEPLKTHPNLEILINKHPPAKTGCTWCHLGQGTATAPADHAHGSPHETDQTSEINEPILQGKFKESTCRNCHAEVVNLEGAPVLSMGKRLFIKLGCPGCHLADGYSQETKVGPRLLRIASKADPSWIFRWVKNPKEYLPKTRMPDFGFNDKEALATVAYLMDASQKGYQLPERFESGNVEKGQKLFDTIGCQACHELNGKGEEFGPDLSRIAGKVSPDWLVSWLSNPKNFNDKSLMPNMRLSKDQASDITAYLLQFGEKKPVPGIEEKIRDPKLIEYGKTVVRSRGCFACHDIKGMEKEGRIAPELSSFGRKMISELEFGDSHIPHTWESWVRNKLKKPDSFRTERVLDKMPNFHLAPDEIDALVVLLKGFNGTKVPEQYRKNLTDKEKTLEQGRRLITKYNCKGCHHVEGEGGRIQKYLKGKKLFPPPLENGSYHVGERIKGSWLFSFLINPTPVRTWLITRMPTFFLSDHEVRDLTAYFEALSPKLIEYEAGVNTEKEMEKVNTGVRIVNYMDCGNCHDDGEKGIDFSIASQRLRQEWIPRWLKETREMIPWTKMPSHWPKEGDKFVVPKKFSLLEEVGTVDQQVESISDFILAYNTADIDFEATLGEAGGGDEEEEEVDEEEEE